MRSHPELSPPGARESLHTSAVSAAAPAPRPEDGGSRPPGRCPWLCPHQPKPWLPCLVPGPLHGAALAPAGGPTHTKGLAGGPSGSASQSSKHLSTACCPASHSQKSGSRGSDVKAKDATPRTTFQGASSGQCPGPGRDVLAPVACRPGCAFPRAQCHQPSGPGSVHRW